VSRSHPTPALSKSSFASTLKECRHKQSASCRRPRPCHCPINRHSPGSAISTRRPLEFDRQSAFRFFGWRIKSNLTLVEQHRFPADWSDIRCADFRSQRLPDRCLPAALLPGLEDVSKNSFFDRLNECCLHLAPVKIERL